MFCPKGPDSGSSTILWGIFWRREVRLLAQLFSCAFFFSSRSFHLNLSHEHLSHRILTRVLKFLCNFLFLCYLHFQIFSLVARDRKKDQHHSQCISYSYISVSDGKTGPESSLALQTHLLQVLISLESVKCLVLG